MVLEFSYIGYQHKSVTVSSVDFLNVTLAEGVFGAEDVTVVGSRFIPRTSITTPVPIDNIKVRDLQSTAQTSFDKMLHYVVPSFNKLRLNGAASFYEHSIEGKINTPEVLAADGVDIFDRKEQSRLLSARPNTKIIAGASYDFSPLTVGVTGTHFGEVTWQHASDPAKDQTFSAKVLVDLNASYRLTKEFSLSLLVNNVFGTYPDEIDPKGDVVTDLGGRFRYPWEVNQFGFNGRVILGSANISF